MALRVTPRRDRDGVIAALFDAGSQGIQEDGAEIVTHFPPGTDVAGIVAGVERADAGAVVKVADAPDTDFSSWRASVSSHAVGDLVISPPWLAHESEPSRTVVIDPAMAFGTGEHPTTRGVIRLMQRVIRAGDIAADLGAGSAALSIAAAHLGASRVVAIELDHDAIGNAEENVRANGVGAIVSVIEGDAGALLPLLAPVDLVLANIISSVLTALLPVIRASLGAGGRAILSGILAEERDEMLRVVARNGFAVTEEDTEGAWWSVAISRQQLTPGRTPG